MSQEVNLFIFIIQKNWTGQLSGRLQKHTACSLRNANSFHQEMKIHEPQKFLQNLSSAKTYLLHLAKPGRKKNQRICIFIYAARKNQQQQDDDRCCPPFASPWHARKKKKKPGELITHHHHPFVDPPSSIIIKWYSSSCFPTWEVQILEHHRPSLLWRSCLEKLFCFLRTKIQVRENI